MARSTRSARNSRAKVKGVSVDFSNVGKMFEEDMEYPVVVKACALEDGNEYPYFSFQFAGLDDEYAESIMYHNASTSPQSLWRLKPLLEAFGMEIPEGPMDIDPEELVGMSCMCSTVKEKKPGGGTSIKPDEFWPLDEADKPEETKPARGKKEPAKDEAPARGRRSAKKEEPTIDLDAMSDDDIEKLAEEFSIVGRTTEKLKKGLAECDPAELAEACADLGIDLAPAEEEEPPARGRRGKAAAKEELAGKSGRSARGSAKSKNKLAESEIDEMSEEELEDLVAQYDLDVDLGAERTLRKKKNVIKDALEAADLLE